MTVLNDCYILSSISIDQRGRYYSETMMKKLMAYSETIIVGERMTYSE